MDSLDHIKSATIQELQDAVRIRCVNMELLEYLTSSLRWILRNCQKHNMEIPEKDKIMLLIDRAIEIDNKTPMV
jgi:hypothetical protein